MSVRPSLAGQSAPPLGPTSLPNHTLPPSATPNSPAPPQVASSSQSDQSTDSLPSPSLFVGVACASLSMGKVHGSLARAGKVKSQTPKVEPQEKKKKVSQAHTPTPPVAAADCCVSSQGVRPRQEADHLQPPLRQRHHPDRRTRRKEEGEQSDTHGLAHGSRVAGGWLADGLLSWFVVRSRSTSSPPASLVKSDPTCVCSRAGIRTLLQPNKGSGGEKGLDERCREGGWE